MIIYNLRLKTIRSVYITATGNGLRFLSLIVSLGHFPFVSLGLLVSFQIPVYHRRYRSEDRIPITHLVSASFLSSPSVYLCFSFPLSPWSESLSIKYCKSIINVCIFISWQFSYLYQSLYQLPEINKDFTVAREKDSLITSFHYILSCK